MSSVELGGAPYLFSQSGTFPAPYTFKVPATLELQTDAASATYNGAGAGGDFLPALSFYSPEGVRLATIPIQTAALSPGDSAEVSWFPFAPAASSGASTRPNRAFGSFNVSSSSILITSTFNGIQYRLRQIIPAAWVTDNIPVTPDAANSRFDIPPGFYQVDVTAYFLVPQQAGPRNFDVWTPWTGETTAQETSKLPPFVPTNNASGPNLYFTQTTREINISAAGTHIQFQFVENEVAAGLRTSSWTMTVSIIRLDDAR